MSIRFLSFGVALLFFPLAACDRAQVSVSTGPTAVASTLTSSTFSFEPSTLRPEVVAGTSCTTRSLFGTRIILVIHGRDGLILRGLRFRFNDRFGRTALPRVIPIPGTSPLNTPLMTFPTSPIPTPGIAPLPATSPIPIPGASPVPGFVVPFGTLQTLPFFLVFDCDIASEGMLFVFIDTATANGGIETSELRARVGS
jgi:hypothetical protein